LSQVLYWVIKSCNFITSIHELMKWVMALRIQGQIVGPIGAWKEDQTRGVAMRPNSKRCTICSRNLLIPVSYVWPSPVIAEPYLWLFLTDSLKSNILHLGKGRAPLTLFSSE
jgi:hypothetical protein